MRTFTWSLAALLAFNVFSASIAGCEPAERMRPGESCGSCHTRSARPNVLAENAPVFGAAGTVYPDKQADKGLAGATVHVVDDDGKQVSMTTNDVGNFYTTTALKPPLRVRITSNGQTIAAANGMASGDCNNCHTPSSYQGRLHAAERRLP